MMPTRKESLQGSLLLLLGSVIWGAAFVAQRVGMEHIAPFTFTGIRMLLGGAVMIPAAKVLDRKTAAPAGGPREQRRAGIACGLFLFAATCLQQVGLVSTGAGKAGFLTALYVVLVPLAGWILLRKNPGKVIWVGVALAVAALYMLCMPAGGGTRLESGDLMLLGCAVCFTGQILCIDRYAPRVSGARLSRDQFLITGGLAMIIAVLTEEITLSAVKEAAGAILYTGLMSTAVGYTLQIFGQKKTNPTVASLIMCMESVFAVLTGALLLGERLTGRETAGCILMFTAVLLAQMSPWIGEKLTARRRRG